MPEKPPPRVLSQKVGAEGGLRAALPGANPLFPRMRVLRVGFDLRLCLVGLALMLVGSHLPVSAQAVSPVRAGAGNGAVARPSEGSPGDLATHAAGESETVIYLPVVARPPGPSQACEPIPGASYSAISVNPPPTDRPAEAHADLNLSLRSYKPVNAQRGLVDYGGNSDSAAPQLPGLFADNRTAAFSAVYQVYNWDWGCNCRGSSITNPGVTLAALATTRGETIHVPNSGYSIGRLGNEYEVLVLYASADRITLKYTRDDNVVHGYTLHHSEIVGLDVFRRA